MEGFMVLDLVMFAAVQASAILFFRLGVITDSWGFTLKWATLATVAIVLLVEVAPQLEFTRLALAFFIVTVIFAKSASPYIRNERDS